jgi:hypothetical protein
MTLDCPQVVEWLIKALGETFAPFVQPEKPQVFPRPATSFIKAGRMDGPLGTEIKLGVAPGIGRPAVSKDRQTPAAVGFLRPSDAAGLSAMLGPDGASML